jgi:hypothetical protein
MTRTPLANAALFMLALIALLFVMNDDFEQDMESERREWAQAVTFCHRAFGPQTQPEYDHQNRLICVGRKGQRHNEVRPAKQ